MAFNQIHFPETLAFGARGGRGYSTDIVINAGGYEKRNKNWGTPLGKWEVGLVNRSLNETRRMQAFFHAADGSANSFLFFDKKDGLMSRAVMGKLTSTTYQLRQRYTDQTVTTFLNVYHPYSEELVITFGTVPTDDYTVDLVTGIVTFFSAVDSNVQPRASGRFAIQVRFDVDTFEPEQVDYEVFSWPSIPLVEVRP